MKKYDAIVIGGGSAGFNVLQQLQGQGLKLAVVENRKLGGACPNYACVPSKALLKCAEIFHTAENTENFLEPQLLENMQRKLFILLL